MTVPLTVLTGAPTGTPVAELNLVEMLPGWAAGFRVDRWRQRHVLAARDNHGLVVEVFVQETHNN